jgi:DNA-binding transcriptional MerR regulator
MDTWSVKQVAEQLNIGRSTVQQRADAYSWALSPSASPGKGGTRRFTPKDYAILEEIERLQGLGMSHEQIEADLRQDMQTGRYDMVYDFPQEPTGSISIIDHSRVVGQLEAVAKQAMARAEKLESELLTTKERVAYLEGQLEEVRQQIREKAENTGEIIRLNREIARLELMLEQERTHPANGR